MKSPMKKYVLTSGPNVWICFPNARGVPIQGGSVVVPHLIEVPLTPECVSHQAGTEYLLWNQ